MRNPGGGDYGPKLQLRVRGRQFLIGPVVVDEGWELWVMDGENRLECGGRISIDDAVTAARKGQDSIQIAADHLKATVLARLAVKS